MTKLEAIISGYGSHKARCIWAAFVLSDPETAEEINLHYFGGFIGDFTTPRLCIDIIKKEYKAKFKRLSRSFLSKLVQDMMRTDNEFLDDDNLFELTEILDEIDDER